VGKIIIITNSPVYCGGTLALSTLCVELRKLGYDARLLLLPYFPREKFSQYAYMRQLWKYSIHLFVRAFIYKFFRKFHKFSKYRVPGECSYAMEGIKFQYFPIFDKDNSIIIYSEDIYGNPLAAKHVMRWLLYMYDYDLDDNDAFSLNDFFVAYRKVFNIGKLNPDCNIVKVMCFDSKIYRQYNFEERKGNCYMLYKGRYRADIPKKFDGPVFDKDKSETELVKILNEYKYCYIYDTQTFYATIAAVCGCIPIVVMESGKTEIDYLGSDKKHVGIAYGDTPEQIQYAIDTRDELLRSLDFSESNRANATHMIDLLTERFGEIKTLSK